MSLVCSTEFLGVSGWAKFTGPKRSTFDGPIQPGMSGKRGSFSLTMKKKCPILEFLAPVGQCLLSVYTVTYNREVLCCSILQ